MDRPLGESQVGLRWKPRSKKVSRGQESLVRCWHMWLAGVLGWEKESPQFGMLCLSCSGFGISPQTPRVEGPWRGTGGSGHRYRGPSPLPHMVYRSASGTMSEQ